MNKNQTEAVENIANAEAPGDVLPGRRRVLGFLGTTAVALPVLGLTACGGDDSGGAASTSAPMPAKSPEATDAKAAMEDAAESMEAAAEEAVEDAGEMMDDAAESAEAMVEEAADTAEEAAGAMAAEAEAAADTIATDAGMNDGMAPVDQNGAMAMGLGYREDATTVDSSAQARYQAGQQCSNCVLFQGGDKEWGGCPLFAGKVVKSTGWCSAYSAAS